MTEGRVSPPVLKWGGIFLCLIACAIPARAGVDLWVDPAAVVPISFQTISSSTFACAVAESCLSDQTTNRRVMRFGNMIVNLGDTDLNVGTPPPFGQSDDLFHWDTCHGHHHLKQIMRYELLNSSGVVTVGRKQNFCMADTKPWAPNAPPPAHTCTTVQGLTRGWADLYDPDLDCQWLDITGLPNGVYTLRLTVDPTNAYAEDNETNNVTTRVVVLEATTGVETPAPVAGFRLVNARPTWGAEAVNFSMGSASGRAKLAVYDVTGAERRTLLDQEEPAGATEYVQWRGLDQSGRLLPSGVYYVRLRIPGATFSKAVLIIAGW